MAETQQVVTFVGSAREGWTPKVESQTSEGTSPSKSRDVRPHRRSGRRRPADVSRPKRN